MSYVVLTLLLAVIFGLDGPETLLAVLFAAFFIHLMRHRHLAGKRLPATSGRQGIS